MAWLVFALSFYVIFCHYACDLTSRMTVTPNKLDIREHTHMTSTLGEGGDPQKGNEVNEVA